MTRWALAAGGAAVALAGFGTLVAALMLGRTTLALFRLPPPSGAFSVGTGPLVIGGRSAAQAWYPALEGQQRARARYDARPPQGPLHRRLLGALVRTDAQFAAAMRPGRFPVLLYFPGWGGLRSDNTALAQSLASHGFIVLGLDDPLPTPPMDFSSAASFSRTRSWADRKVALEAEAGSRLLGELRAAQAAGSAGELVDALDLHRVGAFGFSFGGAVSAQLSLLDPHVAAVADLDGWLFGEAARDGVERPFLIASSSVERKPRSQDPGAFAEFRFTRLLDEADDLHIDRSFARYGGYLLRIEGTDHNNFADAGLLPSLRRTGLGPIDGRRAGRILDAYLVQFFEYYLRGVAAPALAASGKDPTDEAAVLRVWPALASRRAEVSGRLP